MPDRKDEWRNGHIFNTHKSNARNPVTKFTYYADGTGRGHVGANHVVTLLIRTEKPGKYIVSARVVQGPALAWSSDGMLTLDTQVGSASTFEVRFKVWGIVEYWKQAPDGERPAANPCELAGDWFPTRLEEWVCKADPKLMILVTGNFHARRARDPRTKLSFHLNGHFSALIPQLVGVSNVFGLATNIAPCQWTSCCHIPAYALQDGPWSCDDGKLTLSPEGILVVVYSSASVVEFWQRADDSGVQLHAQSVIQSYRNMVRIAPSRWRSVILV